MPRGRLRPGDTVWGVGAVDDTRRKRGKDRRNALTHATSKVLKRDLSAKRGSEKGGGGGKSSGTCATVDMRHCWRGRKKNGPIFSQAMKDQKKKKQGHSPKEQKGKGERRGVKVG